MMAHDINKFLISRGHRVRVLLNQALKHNISKPYDWEGVQVFPPNMNTAGLFETSDIVLTHLDYTRDTIAKCMIHKKPCIQFVHNDSPYPSVINKPDVGVVYNSKWVRDALNYKNKGFVLYPPCDFRHYGVCDNPEANEYITLINLDWNKGGEMLTKIANALPDRKFIGVQGSYSYDSRGQFLKQPKNVKVVPNTPDILSIYRQTRVLIMPSHYESWGRTATEAMCSGIPVVASRTPGLNENLDHAGLFVEDRNDLDAWLRWIKRLDNKQFYKSVSERCIKRAKELDPVKNMEDLERFMIDFRLSR